MPTFPTLNADYGMKKETKFRTIVHNLGGGYEQRINKTPASGLHKFRLSFKKRLISDMAVLLAFYKARLGPYEPFDFTDPLTGNVHQVRFEGDRYDEEFFAWGLQKGEIELVEVL